MMSDNYTQYNDTELAALLGLDKPIDRAEMIRLARADDVEDFAQALEAAMDSQIYVPSAHAVTDMYRAALDRAAEAEAEVARLTADVKAANHEATQLTHELAALGIEYDGDDPLARLVEEVTTLRAQLDAAGWREMEGTPPRWRDSNTGNGRSHTARSI